LAINGRAAEFFRNMEHHWTWLSTIANPAHRTDIVVAKKAHVWAGVEFLQLPDALP
jgi:hypothetical protein